MTGHQKRFLDIIRRLTEQNGYCPSYDEIAKEYGVTSLATIYKHVTNLTHEGYIRRRAKCSRSLELVPAAERKEARRQSRFISISPAAFDELHTQLILAGVKRPFYTQEGHTYLDTEGIAIGRKPL